MTTKQIKALQKEFLKRCVQSARPLKDIFNELKIPYATFVSWTGQREFKSKLHGMRRFLRQARDLQLDVSSFRAAGMLAIGTTVAKKKASEPQTRAICVDVIRLARDSRVRRRSQSADAVGRDRLLSHPDLSDDEATQLTVELSESHLSRKRGGSGKAKS